MRFPSRFALPARLPALRRCRRVHGVYGKRLGPASARRGQRARREHPCSAIPYISKSWREILNEETAELPLILSAAACNTCRLVSCTMPGYGPAARICSRRADFCPLFDSLATRLARAVATFARATTIVTFPVRHYERRCVGLGLGVMTFNIVTHCRCTLQPRNSSRRGWRPSRPSAYVFTTGVKRLASG